MRNFKITLILLMLANVGIAQRSVRDQMRLVKKIADSSATYFFNIPENEDFDYFIGSVKTSSILDKDLANNEYFQLRNDSLLSKYSFDFEGFVPNPLLAVISSPSGLDTAIISITDISGKWDTDGIADADIAKKYPHVNQGDYIIWNYSSGRNLMATPPSLSSGKKVLIHAKKYGNISINLQNCSGSDPSNRIIITNFLGQVETQNGIELKTPQNIRFTGEYDPVKGIGHKYFKGCKQDTNSVNFAFSHGTFGIYQNNQWQSETIGSGLWIDTDNTGVEIDHIEVANGGFNGIRIGWTDTYSISNHTYIHHNFIHDIGAEGILLGVPRGFPQQIFQNAMVLNNAFVRCGAECIQATWISTGSRIRNNFMHGAVDWKNPFARWQDGVIEISSLGGDVDIMNNVLMGGGSVVSGISTRQNLSPLSYPIDTLNIENNLIWRNRSNVAFYLHSTTDNKTQVKFNGNFFAHLGYDIDEVYTNGDTTNNIAMGLNNTAVSVTVVNNTYDYSIENLVSGSSTPILSNNKKLPVSAPEFENYMGKQAGYNYLKVSRYTDYIGMATNFPNSGTNKGNPASWEIGDIVQTWNSDGKTRFYECLTNTNNPQNQPPKNDTSNASWQLLTWLKPDGSISFFPPDNVILKSSDFYYNRNIGILPVLLNNPPPPPPAPNIPPVISIVQPVNKDKVAMGVNLNVQANASDPDGAIFSVRFVLNGQTLKWDNFSPFTASYTPTIAGVDSLYAVAYDSDGDSTISTVVTINVLNPNHFRVLHFTKGVQNSTGIAPQAHNMLVSEGNSKGFNVDEDSTGNTFNALINLQQYDVIIFNNTSGNNLLNPIQRTNFENYINGGGSFIGIHAAANAYRHSTASGTSTGQWDWYAELLGASVADTPTFTNPSSSVVIRKTTSHPIISGISDPWFYQGSVPYWYKGYTSNEIKPLLEVDVTGNQVYDSTRFIAWYRTMTNGSKVFYTGLGGSASDFTSNQLFRDKLIEAILWTQKNELPQITINTPLDGDTIYHGNNYTVDISANDPDGIIDSVNLILNNKVIATDISEPWNFTLKAEIVGKGSLTAIAFDNDGGSTTTLPTTIHIVDTITGDTIILNNQNINENYPAGSYIGTLSGSSSFKINHEAYDGWYFMIQGDSLLSRMSFNYEAFFGNNLSNSKPKVEIESASGKTAVFNIDIIQATGKYDENGYADQDIVNKYLALGDSSLKVGDYIIFNWSTNSGMYGWFEYPSLSYPNQIKIMSGFYTSIHLNMDNAAGNNTKQPIIITNWLGQVEYNQILTLSKCNSCRLTGEYNPEKRTGNKYFDASIHDSWKHRGFGFYRDARTNVTNSSIKTLGSGMTKIEIDHMELTGGGYDGINFKDDNANGGIVDSCNVHDMYIHDIKNEGLYMGNTKDISTHGVQQHFTNTRVENNLFVRCGGEGYQFQRGIGGNIYQNNVIWSGMVCLDPFQNFQFGGIQMEWADGGNIHRDQIVMGAVGDVSSLIKPRLGEVGGSYNGIPNQLKTTLFYCLRGNGIIYMNNGNNGFPSTQIDSIYMGYTRLEYNRINNQWDPNGSTDAITIQNWSSPISIGSIYYDNSITNATNGHTNAQSAVQQTIVAPHFENIFGNSPLPSLRIDSIHRWYQWYPRIWDNTSNGNYLKTRGFKVGDPVIFKVGDVVLHWTPISNRWMGNNSKPVRFYYCKQSHNATTVTPGETSGWENYWELIIWTRPDGSTSYFPPDDFDLVPGSYYEVRGLGLKRPKNSSGSSGNGGTGGSAGSGGFSGLPCQNPPSLAITNPNNGQVLSTSNQITAQVSAFDADGLDSVSFYINDVYKFTDNQLPYEWVLPQDTGTFELKVIAWDACVVNAKDSVSFTMNAGPIDSTCLIPPTLSMKTPAINQGDTIRLSLNQSYQIEIEATDFDGINHIKGFQDYVLFHVENLSPYNWTLPTNQKGIFRFTGTAFDNCNQGSQSDSLYFYYEVVDATISCATPPSLTISSPANGAAFVTNQVSTAVVAATDNDGIDSVSFYVNDQWVGVDLTSAYSWILPTANTGQFEFKVIAWDTCGVSSKDSINYTVNTSNPPPTGNADFCEQNGLIVIDPENLSLPSGWKVGTSEAGYSGNGYIYYDDPSWSSSWFNTTGNAKISISINISNPGTYEFKWRNQAGGNDTREENDTWLRFPDADDFFAIKNGTQLFKPSPDCNADPNANCPQGASNNGWFKVYVNNLNWQWFAGTSDKGPATEIFATFNTPGTYTLEISARSKDHFIDKIVMYDNVNTSESSALNTALAETKCAPPAACAFPPTVKITAQATLVQNTSYIAQVNASDNDGIDSVAFYINDIRQAVDLSSPYTYNLPTGTPGTYEFKAIAYDTCLQSNADSMDYAVLVAGNSYQAPNFSGGRIALLHDGNQADADDIGAMPMMFFQAYYAGLIDTIVWCGYSNLAGSGCRTTFTTNGNGTFNDWCEMMDNSAAWVQNVLGANPSIFHDINEEYNAASWPNQYDKIPALPALVTQINASSASNPLWILAGAPHDIIWRALRDANPSKHQYVWIISHSSWNEDATYGGNQYTFKNIQNSYPNVNMMGGCTKNYTNPCLEDQNHSVADGATDADFRDESGGTSWNWMYANQQGNAISDWLRKQNVDAFFINKNGASVDWSDAGMMWFLLSGGPNGGGDQQGTSSKVKYLFDNGKMP